MIALLLLSHFFSLVSGGALCQDPLYYGEFRPVQSPSRCLGTADNHLVISECKGWSDQIHMYCSDGTFRNDRSKFCLQANSKGNLQYYACEVLPEVPDYQKWSVYTKEDFVDDFGISQTKLSFKSQKDDSCMWLSSSSQWPGTETQTHSCDKDSSLMYFFFRSKGRLLQSGYMRNQADSTKCVEAEGGNKDANVGTHTCNGTPKQTWKYYESGELVNVASGCCMGGYGTEAGMNSNLGAGACDYHNDERWDTPEAYADGNHLGYRNLQSNLCMDVVATTGFGNMVIYTCELRSDQRFEWVSENWTPPNAEWTLVQCNENGKISLDISNTISYEDSITQETGFQIESTIEAGLIFEKVSTSISVSMAVATTWSRTYEETVKTSVSCDYYPSGEEFKGGCMWQLKVETADVTNKDLVWMSSSIIRCTKGLEKPVCPPFTPCQDEECQSCADVETGNSHNEL